MNKRMLVSVFLALALLVPLAFGPGGASAEPGDIARLEPNVGGGGVSSQALPPPGVVVVPAASFRSDGYEAHGNFFSFYGGYWQGADGVTNCLHAPIYPPDLSRVIDAWASVVDNDTVNNFSIVIRRVHNITGQVTDMAAMTTTSAYPNIRTPSDETIVAPLIDTRNYSYFAGVCLYSSAMKLYSVRIWYDEPYGIYLPLIRK